MTLTPTCFGSCRNHRQGAIPCLAKNYKVWFVVHVGTDAVSVMAAYQPVVRAVSIVNRTPAEQADMPPNIDCVYTDEHRKTS